MKKIAITQRLIRNENIGEVRDALDVRWAPFLREFDLLPVILPTHTESIEAYFAEMKIDGVIFSGGNSLARFSDDPLSAKRDEFEKKLLACALKKELPIWGVCRGMQVIAEYFGADLSGVVGHVATRHHIDANVESRYYKYLASIDEVNSYHEYAVVTPPKDFIISAKSADGTIEAIEHRTLPIWAQMWHPEREEKLNRKEHDLIGRIFERN